MSDATPDIEATSGENRPRLLAVEIGDWPGLRGTVRLELDERRTVLVGRNGAGKSLLLEGLIGAARQVTWHGVQRGATPRYFRCDIQDVDDSRIAYEYRVNANEERDEEERETVILERAQSARILSWSERCWRIETGADLWSVSDLKLFVGSGDAVPFPPGVGLAEVWRQMDLIVPPQVRLLTSTLAGFRTVPAGVPRRGDRREVLIRGVRGANDLFRRWQVPIPDRVGSLARGILLLSDRHRETYEEFVTILRRFGLVQEIGVEVYETPKKDTVSEWTGYAAVLFDGTNIGLQSDGTLRVAEIVLQLLQSGVTCLLIEEPETAVHPGLLAKLLALTESYSLDRQIVISTHSPQVLNAFSPGQLRLVERSDDLTQVHALSDEDLRIVVPYLEDCGTLADFLFERSSA